MNTPELSYDDLEARLRGVDAELSAAEAHGLATGLLITGGGSADALLKEVLPVADESDVLAEECRTALRNLFQKAAEDLADSELGFDPLLPRDNKPLRDRAAALRDWCAGVLYGLGISAGPQPELSAESSEAMHDIAEITRLDIDTIGDTEEEEQTFTYLREFLRMAVLMIHADTKRGENPE